MHLAPALLPIPAPLPRRAAQPAALMRTRLPVSCLSRSACPSTLRIPPLAPPPRPLFCALRRLRPVTSFPYAPPPCLLYSVSFPCRFPCPLASAACSPPWHSTHVGPLQPSRHAANRKHAPARTRHGQSLAAVAGRCRGRVADGGASAGRRRHRRLFRLVLLPAFYDCLLGEPHKLVIVGLQARGRGVAGRQRCGGCAAAGGRHARMRMQPWGICRAPPAAAASAAAPSSRPAARLGRTRSPRPPSAAGPPPRAPPDTRPAEVE